MGYVFLGGASLSTSIVGNKARVNRVNWAIAKAARQAGSSGEPS